MSWLRVALCQLGSVVGDLSGNVERLVSALGRAEEAGADLAVFPELAITGYPPEDLLLKPGFVADNTVALSKVARATEQCAAIVGFVDERLDLFNSAAVCAGGDIRGIYHKCNLPNYSVFDAALLRPRGRGGSSVPGRRRPGGCVGL
jgi:NAD+ synthase (glutamine-hydrolysing)